MRVFLKNKLVIDFFASLMFFTRISISWSYFSDKPPNLTRASWSFPLIGLFIGVLSGIIPAYTASKLDPVEAIRR